MSWLAGMVVGSRVHGLTSWVSFRIFQIGEISSTAYSSVANSWHFGKMLQQVAQIKDSYWYTSNPAPIRKKVNLWKMRFLFIKKHLNCKNFRLAAKHQRPFKVWSLVTTSLVLWFCRVFWELSRNGFDHGGWGYDLVQVTVTGRCKVPPENPKRLSGDFQIGFCPDKYRIIWMKQKSHLMI